MPLTRAILQQRPPQPDLSVLQQVNLSAPVATENHGMMEPCRSGFHAFLEEEEGEEGAWKTGKLVIHESLVG